MKPHLVFATVICLLTGTPRVQSEESPSGPPAFGLAHLESHLLDSPAFSRPFYDLLTQTLDESGWKNLDARWQKQEASNIGHAVLRGLLAERQGEFETALAHYERARATDWGGYHHARLLAFMGRVAPAKEALLTLARKTNQAWIFSEVARGVGELLLLTEDAAAAERHYAALWQARPELEMRLALLEPLLTLRMELGTGAEWLKKLEPPLNWESGSLSVADMDQRVLWYCGASLAATPAPNWRAFPPPPAYQRSRMKDTYLHMESPMSLGVRWLDELVKQPGVARWYGPFRGHFPLWSSNWPAADMAQSAIEQPQLDDEVGWTALSLAARKGSQELVRVTQMLKEPLCQDPRLLNMVLSGSPQVLAEAHGDLQRSVFAGSHHPLWRLWSLILRSRFMSEKPEALRAEAVSLWQQSTTDQVFPPRWLALQKARSRPLSPTLALQSQAEDRPGVEEPQTTMVWNVRGASFLKAMAPRFQYELEKTFWDAETTRSLVLPADSTPDSVSPYIALETGPQIQAALWMMREKLGLNDTALGTPATPSERACRVLVQNDPAVIRQVAQDKAGLKVLPLHLLFRFKKALNEQAALSRDAGDVVLPQALATVNEELLTRLPSWTLPRLLTDSPVTVAAAPALTPEERRELLVGHYSGAASTKNWEQWLAVVPNSDKLNAELAAGRESLQIDELPHPLWGLQWQPSLRRLRALLGRPRADSDPSAPLFLTKILPDLVRREHDTADLFDTTLLDAASFKLINRFGFALLRPQPARYTELRTLSPRHPFAQDLVTAWQAMESAPPAGRSALRRSLLTPGQFAAVEAALAHPASRDTRLMLMTLYRDFGDAETARPFEEECANVLLPAPLPRSSGTPVAGVRSTDAPKAAPAVQAETVAAKTTRLEKAVNELLKAAAKAGGEDAFFEGGFSGTRSSLQEAYDWLRQQDRTAPGFEARAGLLAAMARRLNVPTQDRVEMEELDLRLHPEDPARWLRLAASQNRSSHTGAGDAADSFLQALKRIDFSVHDELFRKIRPARGTWAQLANTPAQRDELATVLGAALARTPRGAARSEATRLIEGIARASDGMEKPRRLEELLQTVVEHQRHLILTMFRRLNETAADMERGGKSEAATFIARTLLRGVWGGARPPRDFGGVMVKDLPSEAHAAFGSWSRTGDQDLVDSGSPMQPLFVKALHGEDAATFVGSLVNDVAAYPHDEQLVSCAAVARVMKGGAVEDALRLADDLGPQAKMRVAWRICEITHPAPKDLAKLAPVLMRGMEAVLQDPQYLKSGSRHLMLAEKLLPWLEQAPAAEIQPLVAHLAKDLEDATMDPTAWKRWLDFARRHKVPAVSAAVAKAWKREWEKVMAKGGVDENWYQSSLGEFCALAARLDAQEGHPFVLLADEVWSTSLKNWSGRVDPLPGSVMQLCDQLVAYGETERLTALVSQIETILRLGGSPDYHHLLLRAREGLEFLRTPGRLATPNLWVEDVPGDETTGRVHWDLVTPMPNGGFIVLKRTSKTHHLKILAGGSFDGLQPVAEVPHISPAGIVEVKNMPPSGFAQGLLCNEDASLVSIGTSTPYSLRHPLLDSADGPDASLPEWEEPQFKNCGQPITKAVAVDAGLSVVTSQIVEEQPLRESGYLPLYLVALDANKKPVGAWSVPDGRSSRRMTAEGTRTTGLALSSQYHIASERQFVQPPPHYIVLAAPVNQPADPFAAPGGNANADRQGVRALPYRAQVRTFQQNEPPVAVDLPELKHTPLAKVGFPIRSWQLCENHPRAVFCGDDQVVMYDTDAVPWKELLRLKDAKIAENGWVFMLSADVACYALTQAAAGTANFTPHVWQLRYSGPGPVPASLNDCPELPLAKVSHTAEMSPNEDAALFMSIKEADALGVVWVDSSHNARPLQIKLPEHDRDTWPFVAWWSADGRKVMIEDNGILVPVERTAGGLRAGKTEQGHATAATIPQGALPGGRFFKSAWVLKNGNILVRMDDKTGMPRRAYKLPGQYTGNPLWWGRRHQSVLLQTANDDLIMVQPQEAKRAR